MVAVRARPIGGGGGAWHVSGARKLVKKLCNSDNSTQLRSSELAKLGKLYLERSEEELERGKKKEKSKKKKAGDRPFPLLVCTQIVERFDANLP